MTVQEKMMLAAEEAINKEKIESVKRYAKLGLSEEIISKGSELPIEEVRKILDESKK